MALFEEKKSCREMRREKISCRAFRREKNILPTRLLEKKILLTRNHPPPRQELNGRPLTWSSSCFETHMASVKVRHWFYRVLDVPGEPMSSCFPSYLSPLSSSMFLFDLPLFLRPSRVYLRATRGSAAGCMGVTWTIHFHLFRRTCCVIGSVPVLPRNA